MPWVGRLGERPRLLGVLEHVARGGELWQHDDVCARRRGGVDRRDRPRAVALEIADDRRELMDGDTRHGRC
jgi:hypothetical protein